MNEVFSVRFCRVASIALCIVLLCCSFAFATSDENETYGEDDIKYSDVEVSSLRISASDTTGLHSIILSLIGEYNPIVKDYTYQSSNGYTNHSIEITPDWSWIASCFVFVVVIFCVFRFIGGLFKNNG